VSFVYPHLFLILILPISFFAFFVLRHKSELLGVFDQKTIERLSVKNDAISLRVRNSILLLALFFMLIAFARPVVDSGEDQIDTRGASLVVALDISASMRAKDSFPNRLEFAKKKIVYLLDSLPNNEISLLAFSTFPFLLAPFSSDNIILRSLIEGIDDRSINMNSTNFLALANLSSELLEKKEPKILIVFTDGGEQDMLERFAEIIIKNRIILYVVLVGTDKGSPILDFNNRVITKNGKIVISRLEEGVGTVAQESGGAYIIADQEENKLLSALIKKIEKRVQRRGGQITFNNREELFFYPLGIALFLLLMGVSSLPRKEWLF